MLCSAHHCLKGAVLKMLSVQCLVCTFECLGLLTRSTPTKGSPPATELKQPYFVTSQRRPTRIHTRARTETHIYRHTHTGKQSRTHRHTDPHTHAQVLTHNASYTVLRIHTRSYTRTHAHSGNQTYTLYTFYK